MFIARFILGTLAAGIAWLSVRPADVVSVEYAVLAGISAFAAAAFASWLSLKRNEQKKLAPVVFSAPCAVLAIISIPAFLGGSKRQLLFWALCTILALVFSTVTDLIIFRKIVDDEEA